MPFSSHSGKEFIKSLDLNGKKILDVGAGYGTDKAIFGYGMGDTYAESMTNKVSKTGVVANDTAGVGTARRSLAAASYGT